MYARRFSKENAAVLVGLLVLWDILHRVRWQSRVPFYAAAIAPAALLWVVRSAVLGERPVVQISYLDNPLLLADFWTAKLTAIRILGHDLILLLFPLHLSVDRGYNQTALSSWTDPLMWLALLVMLRDSRAGVRHSQRASADLLARRILRDHHPSHREPRAHHRLHHG